MSWLPVAMSPELERIFALPRREWRESDALQLAETWSYQLLNDHGKRLWDRAYALPEFAREKELERLALAGTPIRLDAAQAIALYEFVTVGGLVFGALPGIGKCVDENTPIRDPQTGRYRTVRKAVEARQPAIDSFGGYTINSQPISGHWPTGTKECLTLRMASGRTLTVTPEHPMLTPEGWLRADALLPGLTVAAAGSVPAPVEIKELPDHDVDLLAVLFAEGSLNHRQVGFTTADPRILAIMNNAAQAHGLVVKYASGYDYRISRGKHSGPIATSVQRLVRDNGIDCLAKHKPLPRDVWQLNDRQLARFVAVLWMCDGYVSKQGAPGITLASEKAVREIQHLLLRFGVQSSVIYKQARTGGKVFDAWRLGVYSASFDAFRKHMAQHMWGEKLTRLMSERPYRNSNVGFPAVRRAFYEELAKGLPAAKRTLLAAAHVKDSERGETVGLGKKLRETLLQKRRDLLWVTDADIWWDKIESIEDAGVRTVYDLTVDNTHNYLANDLIAHNTLVSALLCTLAHQHWGLTKIVLIVMASGQEQTHADLAMLTQCWQAPILPQVVTYHTIGQPGNAYYLCGCHICRQGQAPDVDDEDKVDRHGAGLQPQLVILDESDCVRNEDSAVHRRVDRVHSNHPTPLIRHVSETATPVRKTWSNIRKPLIWALGAERAPVPSDHHTTEALKGALDDNPRDGVRRAPGVLVQLADPEALKVDPLEACRDGWGKRLTDTPGCVVIRRSSCNAPLHIRVLQAPDDPVLENEYYRLGGGLGEGTGAGETLAGVVLADALSQGRYETEVSTGHYNYYDPPPPAEWASRRKAYLKLVKAEIKASQRWGPAMDSEKDVARKLKREQHPLYLAWKEIEPIYDPAKYSKSATISLSVLQYAAAWARLNSPALIWVQHSWAGEELARLTGLPYYAGKGRTAGGSYIGNADGRSSVILSAHANRRQRNLQAFHRNLIIAPEHSAERIEQQIGRTHRRGQQKPVYVDFLVSAGCSVKALMAARSEAKHVQTTLRMPQKILSVDWDWSHCQPWVLSPETLGEDIRAARWGRTRKDDG